MDKHTEELREQQYLADRRTETDILGRNLQSAGFKLLESNLGITSFEHQLDISTGVHRLVYDGSQEHWHNIIQWQGDGDRSIYVIYIPTTWKKATGADFGRPWQRSEFKHLAGFGKPEILGETSTFGLAGRIAMLNKAVLAAGLETVAFREESLRRSFMEIDARYGVRQRM